MKDSEILDRFGTLEPLELAAIELPPRTCSRCGRVHFFPQNNRMWGLTEKGWRATDPSWWARRNGARSEGV